MRSLQWLRFDASDKHRCGKEDEGWGCWWVVGMNCHSCGWP